MSTTAIWEILHDEGFARLPRRQDAERPATLHPTAAAVAASQQKPLVAQNDKVDVAIIGLGIGLAFSEGGSTMRKALWVVIGLALAFNALTWGLSFLGFSGGLCV